MTPTTTTWCIAALTTAAVIARPWRLPEWIWAVTGAAILVLTGLLPPAAALHGLARGRDVYLFLAGMMLLAELARQEGLFEHIAAHAAAAARGSAPKLFLQVYLVGTVVTAFLSNDATAVVLTPAVAAVTRAAKAEPLPYLLACAFVANAASFVLPISNPANLVIYGTTLPPLLQWVPLFALPSLLSVAATYAALRLTQNRWLHQHLASDIPVPAVSAGGRIALGGIVAMTGATLAASALGWDVGLPICAVGFATAIAVAGHARRSPVSLIKGVSWGVLPLVGGLFVLVEALTRTGLISIVAGWFQAAPRAWLPGAVVAVVCNLMNNLPAGLIAGTAVQVAHAPPLPTAGVLIGIDLGPNLSVTGSLATILWLVALRREGLFIGTWRFLRLGLVVMPPALILALAALMV